MADKYEDNEDALFNTEGMSIKWRAFSLLRRQFNRIDRQKQAKVKDKKPIQSTNPMAMMLADYHAVNRMEKQKYLMYLYQMKRKRYYMNGLRM